MENVLVPVLLAILGGFALFGLLILGVMGVVSFFRAWERGEPEFSSSMPERLDRSPLHSVEARIARGSLSERDLKEMHEQVDGLVSLREAERRRIERGSAP
jgi:hypothetical protein